MKYYFSISFGLFKTKIRILNDWTLNKNESENENNTLTNYYSSSKDHSILKRVSLYLTANRIGKFFSKAISRLSSILFKSNKNKFVSIS